MNDMDRKNAFQKRAENVKKRLSGVRHVIAVMSGKGGVGKTTVSVNLAAVLSGYGPTALVDADIDCPNVNRFLGITERLMSAGGGIVPAESHGMKVVSFASFQEREDQPIIWRGPMLSNAIMQILEQVEWGDLDYLVVDLPPGTSDIPLTIMQMLRPEGVVIVTTPQPVAVTDAKKAANMAKKLGIPVLGIIENMSGEVFGRGGGMEAAKQLGIDFMGSLELDRQINKSSEQGRPFVLGDSGCSNKFKQMARKVKGGLK